MAAGKQAGETPQTLTPKPKTQTPKYNQPYTNHSPTYFPDRPAQSHFLIIDFSRTAAGEASSKPGEEETYTQQPFLGRDIHNHSLIDFCMTEWQQGTPHANTHSHTHTFFIVLQWPHHVWWNLASTAPFSTRASSASLLSK